MSNPSGVLAASVARPARIDPIKIRERVFFSGIAIALAVTVFAGFAPTYYLHALVESDVVLTPSLMLHGAVFSAWMVLLVVQTSLIAASQVRLHRKLGIAGAAIAVAMVVLGAYVAISRTRSGLFANPAGIPPLAFMAVPLATVVVFPALVGSALLFRRRADIHKRLMLIATLEVVTAAIARLPFVVPWGPAGFFGVTDLFLLAIVAYDLVTLRRLHPATLWGGLFLVVSQPLRLLIAGTDSWLAVARWLTS